VRLRCFLDFKSPFGPSRVVEVPYLVQQRLSDHAVKVCRQFTGLTIFVMLAMVVLMVWLLSLTQP
jgi:hypothetical protein